MTEKAPRQTVEFAHNTDTGEVLAAVDLLVLEEADFVTLRRGVTRVRNALKRGQATRPLFECAFCSTPLWLSRHIKGRGNRWFKHVYLEGRPRPRCPWHKPGEFTQAELKAIQFHGQKEGQLHRALKLLIADSLRRDPDIGDSVIVDRTQFGEILKGEWRRPDVRCQWRGRKVVFELQLSYTFIDEVVGRDDFYRAEGSFVIWVFRALMMDRANLRDERYFNKGNLFVLDETAEAASRERGRLVLTCHYNRPVRSADGAGIDLKEESTLVELADLTFPALSSDSPTNFRPFFFDYTAAFDHLTGQLAAEAVEARVQRQAEARRQREAEADRAQKEAAHRASVHVVDRAYSADVAADLVPYYAALTRHGSLSSPADPATSRAIEDAISFIRDNEIRKAAESALKSTGYLVLMRLLSIRQNRPLGTRFATVYQTVDAALQPGADQHRPYGILILSAWEAYRPTANAKQQLRIERYLAQYRNAVFDGDHRYLPPIGFAKLVAGLLPLTAGTVDWLELIYSRSGRQLDQPDLKKAQWRGAGVADRPAARQALDTYKFDHPYADWVALLKDSYEMFQADVFASEALMMLAKKFKVRAATAYRFLQSARLMRPSNP